MSDTWSYLRGETKAVLAVGGVIAAFVAAGVYKYAGPSGAEQGQIVRFGSYANELGNQPTVLVRTEDGRQYTLMASAGMLRQCQVGKRIRLVKTAHRLRVDPRGCR